MPDLHYQQAREFRLAISALPAVSSGVLEDAPCLNGGSNAGSPGIPSSFPSCIG